jgi:hypothetical protein
VDIAAWSNCYWFFIQAYEATYRRLIDLEIRALSEMCTRIDFQQSGASSMDSGGGRESIKMYKSEIQKEMMSKATAVEGFIMWLDFTKKGTANLEMRQRPAILPEIAADVLNIADDEEETAPDNRRRSSGAKKLATGAREIASVCKGLVQSAALESKPIKLVAEHDTRPIAGTLVHIHYLSLYNVH